MFLHHRTVRRITTLQSYMSLETQKPTPQTLLDNLQNKFPKLEMSGMHDKKYVGETKRSILLKIKEHLAQVRFGRPDT